MKIKMLAPLKPETRRTVNGELAKPDSVHEVDANTARNLIKKGFAVAHDDEAKKLDLEEPSRLSEDQADDNAQKIHDHKADAKKAEAKKR